MTAYSVSSLTREIKSALEKGFKRVYLEAEISGWRRYPSGHAYFTLKDADAQISAVMFAGAYASCLKKHPGIEAQLRDGAKVLVYGDVSVYAPRGQYQFVVLAAKMTGEGDLMARYLALKAKLEGEGLFDAARKRPLPKLPRSIGIVTSESGAVIHDMCTVLTRRFPHLAIRLYPASVQGTEAPAQLCAGLAHFAREKPDLVILARGGGSFEDLFCFNDETLVRAVAALPVPIISAVGHETDFTLCDFAADVRAGTPSIAAEIAVPVERDLIGRIDELKATLARALTERGEFFAQRVDHLHASLAHALVVAATRAETRVTRAAARLEPSVRFAWQTSVSRVQRASDKLALLSPYGVLERGYAIVTDASGSVVREAGRVRTGDRLGVRVQSGTLSVVSE